MSGGLPAPVGAGDWDAVVLDAGVPVLVDFWAPWCVPCRAASALAVDAGERHAGRLRTVSVDVDAEPALASRYEVLSVPTLLVFTGGRPVARLDGRIRPARLEAALHAHLDGE